MHVKPIPSFLLISAASQCLGKRDFPSIILLPFFRQITLFSCDTLHQTLQKNFLPSLPQQTPNNQSMQLLYFSFPPPPPIYFFQNRRKITFSSDDWVHLFPFRVVEQYTQKDNLVSLLLKKPSPLHTPGKGMHTGVKMGNMQGQEVLHYPQKAWVSNNGFYSAKQSTVALASVPALAQPWKLCMKWLGVVQNCFFLFLHSAWINFRK